MNQSILDQDGRPDKAFALFAVLSFLLMAAAITTPFVTSARTQALIARNVAAEFKDRLAARGLITLASNALFLKAGQPNFTFPQSMSCRFEQSDVSILFQDHAGLIDLNAASVDLLGIGFKALGASALEAETLAETAIQFRTVQESSPNLQRAEVRGGYKHALFESVDELSDFSLPRSIAAADMKKVFTVQTATGTILDAAIPSSISLVLKELPPSTAYFVVSGQPPLGTVTISVEVWRAGKNRMLASALARQGDGNRGPLLVSPITVGWQPKSEVAALDGQSTCADLFEASELNAMRVLIGEGA